MLWAAGIEHGRFGQEGEVFLQAIQSPPQNMCGTIITGGFGANPPLLGRMKPVRRSMWSMSITYSIRGTKRGPGKGAVLFLAGAGTHLGQSTSRCVSQCFPTLAAL